jgi:hypothetical protein
MRQINFEVFDVVEEIAAGGRKASVSNKPPGRTSSERYSHVLLHAYSVGLPDGDILG